MLSIAESKTPKGDISTDPLTSVSNFELTPEEKEEKKKKLYHHLAHTQSYLFFYPLFSQMYLPNLFSCVYILARFCFFIGLAVVG
jgi:hypothetical protein